MKALKILLLLFIAVSCTNCVTQHQARKYSNGSSGALVQGFGGSMDSDANSKDSYDNTQDVKKQGRKIIYTADISLTVDETDSIAYKAQKIAETNSGYLAYSSEHTVVIKVEADNIHNAVAEIEKLGEVNRSTISTQDVTGEYTDLQIRLENAMKARERYLVLLEKAENVEEALLVEKELERLNLTIDQIKGKLNQFDDRIQYSTVTISFYKKHEDDKPKPGILGYVFVGLYKGVKWLFVR